MTRFKNYVIENISKLVVKPANASGGYGIMIGPKAPKEEREEMIKKIKNLENILLNHLKLYQPHPLSQKMILNHDIGI